ncbi:hypothetical protein HaLaN_17956, partial [Haematococcus lacustris]
MQQLGKDHWVFKASLRRPEVCAEEVARLAALPPPAWQSSRVSRRIGGQSAFIQPWVQGPAFSVTMDPACCSTAVLKYQGDGEGGRNISHNCSSGRSGNALTTNISTQQRYMAAIKSMSIRGRETSHSPLPPM